MLDTKAYTNDKWMTSQFRVTLAVSGEGDRSWMWKDAKHWKVDRLNTIGMSSAQCRDAWRYNVLKSWGVGSMPLSGNESVPGSLRWEQASPIAWCGGQEMSVWNIQFVSMFMGRRMPSTQSGFRSNSFMRQVWQVWHSSVKSFLDVGHQGIHKW